MGNPNATIADRVAGDWVRKQEAERQSRKPPSPGPAAAVQKPEDEVLSPGVPSAAQTPDGDESQDDDQMKSRKLKKRRKVISK